MNGVESEHSEINVEDCGTRAEKGGSFKEEQLPGRATGIFATIEPQWLFHISVFLGSQTMRFFYPRTTREFLALLVRHIDFEGES